MHNICEAAAAFPATGCPSSYFELCNCSSKMMYRPQSRNYTESSFSHREQTLLRLVQEGRSIQQIADALSMSKRTAEMLIQSVGHKLSSFSTLAILGPEHR